MIFAFFSSNLFSKALRWPFSRSDTVSSCVRLLVLQPNLEPLLAGQIGEIRLVDFRAGLELLRARLRSPALDHAAHALEQIVLENALLIGQVLAHPLELRFFNRQGP